MAQIPPEEKYSILVSKLGVDEVKERIKEKMAQGRAASKVRAVDILFDDIQWEQVETSGTLKGFYLGTYQRGPPGLQHAETYVLTDKGPEQLWFDDVEVLAPLDELNGHGLLAPIEVSPINRVQNLGTKEERIRARMDVVVKRINLPPELLQKWAGSIGDIEKAAKPVFLVESITAVRDVPPPEAWVERDGRRSRDNDVPAYPIVTKDGAVNVKLSIGSDVLTTGVKINSGDELLQLLEPDDAESPEAWFEWIRSNALHEHEKTLAELRAFAGRQVVVFGAGGSEIQRKDKDGKREVLALSGSYVTTAQIGFLRSYNNAIRHVREMASGEQVVATPAPTPSAAAPSTKVPVEDAILDVIGDGGAAKDDVKKLLKTYSTDDVVNGVEKLMGAGTIRYDTGTKKYQKVKAA